MGSKNEYPIFTKTNMGTHIIIPVSPDITAGEFKRKLEKAHVESFPELGKVTSITVMQVKKKSNFYVLPDFLPLKHASRDFKQVCFVHVDIQESLEPVRRAIHSRVNDCIKYNQNNVRIKRNKAKLRGIWFLKGVIKGFMAATYTRKKKRMKRRQILKKVLTRDNTGLNPKYVVAEEQIYDAPNGEHNDQKEVLETPCESFSGAVSVSGIINRYFSSLVELEQIESRLITELTSRDGQNELKKHKGDAEKTSARTPIITKGTSKYEKNQRLLPLPLSEDSNSVGLQNKYKRSEVGERLVVASNGLQKSPGSNMSKAKKLLEIDAGSIVGGLVFEIGDD